MPISVPLDRSLISDPSLSPVADKIERGERLSDADGVALFESNDLLAIGHMADRVNLAKNGTLVTFAANHHINPTNIFDVPFFERDLLTIFMIIVVQQ